MKGKKSVLFLFLYTIYLLNAQNHKVDSLLNLLKTALHDTTRFNAYMGLGNYFQNTDPDSALYFHVQAEIIADMIPGLEGEFRKGEVIKAKGVDYYIKSNYDYAVKLFEKSLKIAVKYEKVDENGFRKKFLGLQAACLVNIGLVCSEKGDFVMALNNYSRAYKIYREINNKNGMAVVSGNIGHIYYNQGDFTKALEYFFKALRLNEELENNEGMAKLLENIGLVHYAQADYNKAKSYYFRAMAINNKIKNIKNLAYNYGNIGSVYYLQRIYDLSLDYYFKALNIFKKIGNARGQVIMLNNIGLVYFDRGDFQKTLNYYLLALKINEEINDLQSLAITLSNIGNVYLQKKKYSYALAYLKKAEKIQRELKDVIYARDTYSDLSKLYEQTSRYKEALYYYKEFINARDSVLSEENRKASVVKEMKYNYEKEQALKEKEHQKQLAIEKEKQEKQKLVTRFIIAGLILVVLFSGFIVNRLQVTRKQKRIIEKQKLLVEEQKKAVEEQKLIVEQKNKDITDSIKYSKRIQDAILPHPRKWKEHLPGSFILYLPKDIVAGDFYWMEALDNYIFVAAADCTGHGVPGAMVSVVCSNALTKAVLEEKIANTDEILNRVREIVIEKLTSEENIRDGMDICLARFTKGTKEIQYSGANRPLYMAQDGALREYNPDKQPVARYEKIFPFSKQDIILQKKSMLFLTTDGFADQFGGEKGKKIGTKAFKELLVKISGISETEKQREEMIAYFRQWKGSEEQMDDVTVLGLRI